MALGVGGEGGAGAQGRVVLRRSKATAVDAMGRSGGSAGRSRVRARSAGGEDEHGYAMKQEKGRGALHIEHIFLDQNRLGSK
jgi:hypothetical protein